MADRVVIRRALIASLLPTPSVIAGDLVIEDGTVVAVGPGVAPADEGVDAHGALVLPGLVNAHTHIYSALACGMPGPSVAPTNFVEILERLWWRLDKALDADSLRLSGLVGGLEAARSGVTVLFDHHASPGHIGGSLDLIVGGLSAAGLSGTICYETTDRGGPEQMAAGVAENVRFANAEPAGWKAMLGGHASFTLADATLAALGRARRETARGFHIHVAEDKADLAPGDPVARYDAAGLLGPDTVMAHGVHLTAEALAVAGERGAWLVHNARSNMNNQVGYAGLAPGYAKLAVGTDGIGCDVLTEVRTAFFKARDAGVVTAWDLPLTLLQGGLRMAEQWLGGVRGRFVPGAVGDAVLTDYVPATPLHAENLLGHLLFGFDRSYVARVWAGGQAIWPSPLDTHDIYARSRSAAAALWQRMEATDG